MNLPLPSAAMLDSDRQECNVELTTNLSPNIGAIPAARFTDFLNMSEQFVNDGHSLKQQRLLRMLEQAYWAGKQDERDERAK